MNSAVKTVKQMNAKQLGTLGFNITSFSWVGMCLALGPSNLPAFVPCSYLHPNLLNALSILTFLFGVGISLVAIRRGNIIGPTIALTFLWSVAATCLREAGFLQGTLFS